MSKVCRLSSKGALLALVAGFVMAALVLALLTPEEAGANSGGGQELRVATYNLQDVRTEDVKRDDNPRLKELAATIQRVRPDVILLNEIAYDYQGAPGVKPNSEEGQNARRFVENYLSKTQEPGLAPIRYNDFMRPVNTGIASGYDLDNNGEAVTEYPPPPPTQPDGSPGEQTAAGRAYGNDAYGFGTFPGQYGMGLLVKPQYKIQKDEVRTFQKFLWKDMPGALLPKDPETGESFYSEEELSVFRLSSKSHWDVPVRVPGKDTVHLLASHPTPPVFDGPADRNGRRNHDEIRFWGDYVNDADYIYDDSGERGGLKEDEPFVILGDLNADPDEGDSAGNPIRDFLFANERINGEFVPLAQAPDPELDPSDTATFGLRADYVLPSSDLPVSRGEVRGHTALYEGGPYEGSPTDHFPVWLDLALPKKAPGQG